MPCTIRDIKPVDKSIPVPLYYQLKNNIKDLIKGGSLVNGDAIPAENELAEFLRVSRPTVRQALNELVVEGYLERVKGKGTFVSSPKIDAKFLKRMKTFNEEMEEMGLVPSTAMISIMKIGSRAEINQRLGLGSEDSLIELKRVRSANGEPIMFQETYLPYDSCPGLLEQDFSKVTLYSTLESLYGIVVHRAEREIEAANAPAGTAKLLHIGTGDAIALVRTIAFAQNDRPIEFSISHYCGNRVKFSVELYR